MLNVAKKFVDHTGSLKLAKLLATLFVHPILRKIPNFRKYIFDNLSWAILPLKTRHHKYPFLPRYHVTFFCFGAAAQNFRSVWTGYRRKKREKLFFRHSAEIPLYNSIWLGKKIAQRVFSISCTLFWTVVSTYGSYSHAWQRLDEF